MIDISKIRVGATLRLKPVTVVGVRNQEIMVDEFPDWISIDLFDQPWIVGDKFRLHEAGAVHEIVDIRGDRVLCWLHHHPGGSTGTSISLTNLIKTNPARLNP